MVNKSKQPYVDNGWPQVADGEHAVNELCATRSGGLSPFGEDYVLPRPLHAIGYIHPETTINRQNAPKKARP